MLEDQTASQEKHYLIRAMFPKEILLSSVLDAADLLWQPVHPDSEVEGTTLTVLSYTNDVCVNVCVSQNCQARSTHTSSFACQLKYSRPYALPPLL